jgi:transposase
MNKLIRIGIDLAKNTFSMCGVDEHEHIILERTLKHNEVVGFFANLPSCMVAMGAGSGAHYCQDRSGFLPCATQSRRYRLIRL